MNRRKLIKTLGLSALAISTGMFASCNSEDSETKKELVALKDSIAKSKNIELSERDKKIINRFDMKIKDKENPTKAELKHTPEIKIGKSNDLNYTEVKITVGTSIIHPSTNEHWIDFIELYADDDLVGHINFEAGKASGFAVFKIKIENISKLKAISGCNIHGIWHSELELG